MKEELKKEGGGEYRKVVADLLTIESGGYHKAMSTSKRKSNGAIRCMYRCESRNYVDGRRKRRKDIGKGVPTKKCVIR
jgi:hypothetical protein